MSKAYQNFVTDLDRNKSPATKQVYTDRFRDFCQVYEIRNADQLAGLQKRVFEDQIAGYIDSRVKMGKGYSFLLQAVSAIRYFCLSNRIDLNFPWIFNRIPKPEASDEQAFQDKPYSSSQLEAVFKTALKAKKQRAICSMGIMLTGGARIGALSTIRIENIQYVEKYDLYAILGYPASKRFRYWIITTPQVKKAIDAYKGKRSSGALFISEVDGAPVKTAALLKEIWQLTIKSGVRKVNANGDTTTRHKNMLDHGFRKSHSTILEKAALRDDHISRLRGSHKGLKGVYQLPSPLEICELTEYHKAIPMLSLPI